MRSLVVAVMVLVSPAAEAKDFAKCVVGRLGEIDMKCLGGKAAGTSRLRVPSHGVGGSIPGAEAALFSVLPKVRDCHEAAIARGADGVEGGIRIEIEVDDGGRASPPKTELEMLSDEALIECIVRSFARLRFNAPRVKGAGSAGITIALTASRSTRTKSLTDDAAAMCIAARAMRAEGWHGTKQGVLAELATRFAESEPSPAGSRIVDSLATTTRQEIPAAWRRAITAQGVSATNATCSDLDALLRE